MTFRATVTQTTPRCLVPEEQVYAMKSMLKDHMILKNQVTHVKAERDVMAEADDPWIVKLMYSFQVCNPVYFDFVSTSLFLVVLRHPMSYHTVPYPYLGCVPVGPFYLNITLGTRNVGTEYHP